MILIAGTAASRSRDEDVSAATIWLSSPRHRMLCSEACPARSAEQSERVSSRRERSNAEAVRAIRPRRVNCLVRCCRRAPEARALRASARPDAGNLPRPHRQHSGMTGDRLLHRGERAGRPTRCSGDAALSIRPKLLRGCPAPGREPRERRIAMIAPSLLAFRCLLGNVARSGSKRRQYAGVKARTDLFHESPRGLT
jgi:hypothetical protein